MCKVACFIKSNLISLWAIYTSKVSVFFFIIPFLHKSNKEKQTNAVIKNEEEVFKMAIKKNRDDKSNNALSLDRMIENTEENIREAEISMEFAGPEERENLEEKNERRKHSVDKMKKQLSDEAAFEARKNSFE